MFSWLNWIKDKQKQKRMEQFAEERRFKLNGEYGFSVDGLLVREFGYLLRHVTRGKHGSFQNFDEIADNFVAINGAIVIEMQRDTPREEEVNFTTHEGAIRNLKNLQYIVKCIADYVDLAKQLGLTTRPEVN